MAALLAPFGNCAEFLHSAIVQPLLNDGMQTALKYVDNLDEASFKEKVSKPKFGYLHSAGLPNKIWLTGQ